MKKLLRILMLFLTLTSALGGVALGQNITGPVRGVTFFYLDGVAQDFPWVLANQSDPTVRAKIDNLLAGYRAAGVNWIRLLIAADHFPAANYPQPTQALINQVNDFMAITRAGPNAGRFTVEVVFVTKRFANGYFADYPPYTNDKMWLAEWITKLNYSNLGMILITGDASPCAWEGTAARYSCYGDSATAISPLAYNHGHWIATMWPWLKANWPTLNASYEVIAGDPYNNGELIKKLAQWVTMRTPDVPCMAASLYFELPPGSPWTAYANQTVALLNAYASVTAKPLWIDEYGMRVCAAVGCTYTESDQQAYYGGFLGSTTCWTSVKYPKFAWVAGNDYPYVGTFWYGLASGFSSNQPVWRPAWGTVSLYYNLTACP